ncbi:MAG: cupredoxin domain-containing protein [Methanomicrobiales archaeon]|nr:cupredoxin domain-containing protein [Methanomicrobiales archaeon]
MNETPTPTITLTTTIPKVVGGVSIDLTAQNLAYSLSTITVPPGAPVTVHFTNRDSGVEHNFAVYTTAAPPQIIFEGRVITGPATTDYTFIAPTILGMYVFECDIHPDLMHGQFIVQ